MCELRENLESCFKEVEGESSFVKEMKTDFRKLEAVFLCDASGNFSTCMRYSPGKIGCTFFIDGRCENRD